MPFGRDNEIKKDPLLPNGLKKPCENQFQELYFNPMTKSNLSPLKINSPRLFLPNKEQTLKEPLKPLLLAGKSSESVGKLAKKLEKYNKRTKYSLTCMPRSVETSSSTQLFVADSNENLNSLPPKLKCIEKSKQTNTKTQTEYKQPLSARSYIPKFTGGTGSANNSPRNYYKEATQKQQMVYIAAKPPPITHLKRRNYNLRKYSELRCLASVLTLITVLFWLFSTAFDIECLWVYYENFWLHVRNWFLAKDKPKTKVEIFVTFLQDMWS